MHVTWSKKSRQPVVERQKPPDPAPKTSLPNSAVTGAMAGDHASGNLGARMESRLPTVTARAQARIPQAEAEADRLSANVHATTPEGVKADLGRQMGADFSGVRFHTGADAAAKASAAGARAYTSGADVWFDQQGFNPTVAAHELVHTVQQGMVQSETPTLSTPTGGMQMWDLPWSDKAKEKKAREKEEKYNRKMAEKEPIYRQRYNEMRAEQTARGELESKRLEDDLSERRRQYKALYGKDLPDDQVEDLQLQISQARMQESGLIGYDESIDYDQMYADAQDPAMQDKSTNILNYVVKEKIGRVRSPEGRAKEEKERQKEIAKARKKQEKNDQRAMKKTFGKHHKWWK